MEVIDEIEPTQRNVYTGSIGYVGFNGYADLNIVIRTILQKGRYCLFSGRRRYRLGFGCGNGIRRDACEGEGTHRSAAGGITGRRMTMQVFLNNAYPKGKMQH